MAQADAYEPDDVKWAQILKAREYYEEFSSVPPIRKFAKYLSEEQNAVFKLWMTGPMMPITKYIDLPKPTGCV
jgi:tRNA 2-thiouridine synthesizing protein E